MLANTSAALAAFRSRAFRSSLLRLALLASVASLPINYAQAKTGAFAAGPVLHIPQSWAPASTAKPLVVKPQASAGAVTVTISSAATANITCSSAPVVCTPTGSGAVLNVTSLQTMLAKNNVKITTGSTGTEPGDIDVEAALTWTSAHSLTLDARRSIQVDKHVSITGTGGLTLVTDDGSLRDGVLLITSTGNITFLGLTNVLKINGKTYKLEDNISSLATDIAANPGGNFALAQSYDAKNDGIYAAPPINELDGALEGLGNTISNLSISDKTPATNLPSDDPWLGEIGLFEFVSVTGSVENLGFLKAKIVGGNVMNVGILAGSLFGSVFNTYSTGTVTAGKGVAGGAVFGSNAGGLVGAMFFTSTISHSHSTATVTAGGSAFAGGLAGGAYDGGQIVNSWASGKVTVGNNVIGGVYTNGVAGGLVGLNYDETGSTFLQNDYATGDVVAGSGPGFAGGLVGASGGTSFITRCHATGAVSVGAGSSTNGYSNVGGLDGTNYQLNGETGTIQQSYATGSVSGNSFSLAGGLLGYNYGTVSNSYATGAVSGGGNSDLGGFIGLNDGAGLIGSSYSTGTVQIVSGASSGGFTGWNTGSLANDYWDTTTSGLTTGVGAGNLPSVIAQSTTQLQAGLPGGFSNVIWGTNASINGGLPYLLALPPT